MDLKDKLTIASLAVALTAVITKMKAFETWLDEYMKIWAAKRSARTDTASQKVPMDILATAANSGRTELEIMCLFLKEEWRVDRLTVMEFTPGAGGKGLLATVIVEEHTARMPSIKAVFQMAQLLPEIEAEVRRIHALECHCLYVPVARLVELPAMRAALAGSAVSSAYYQTLPAVAGHAGGLLSLSWKTEKRLTQKDLAALHFSVLSLASVLRMLWLLKIPDEPL